MRRRFSRGAGMSETVTCQICGGVYNRRYLNGHIRLAHGKKNWASLAKNERERIEAIVSLYEQLSEKNKKMIRERLARPDA